MISVLGQNYTFGLWINICTLFNPQISPLTVGLLKGKNHSIQIKLKNMEDENDGKIGSFKGFILVTPYI